MNIQIDRIPNYCYFSAVPVGEIFRDRNTFYLKLKDFYPVDSSEIQNAVTIDCHHSHYFVNDDWVELLPTKIIYDYNDKVVHGHLTIIGRRD